MHVIIIKIIVFHAYGPMQAKYSVKFRTTRQFVEKNHIIIKVEL